MKTENNHKILEKGDKIKCQGILAEIATIHYQDYNPHSDTFIAEFYDTNGEIRNWHQHSDGGAVIPKPPVKIMYIGLEKADANNDDNINNYDIMAVFETEKDAMIWKANNEKYRTYKYCNKTVI